MGNQYMLLMPRPEANDVVSFQRVIVEFLVDHPAAWIERDCWRITSTLCWTEVAVGDSPRQAWLLLLTEQPALDLQRKYHQGVHGKDTVQGE